MIFQRHDLTIANYAQEKSPLMVRIYLNCTILIYIFRPLCEYFSMFLLTMVSLIISLYAGFRISMFVSLSVLTFLRF